MGEGVRWPSTDISGRTVSAVCHRSLCTARDRFGKGGRGGGGERIRPRPQYAGQSLRSGPLRPLLASPSPAAVRTHRYRHYLKCFVQRRPASSSGVSYDSQCIGLPQSGRVPRVVALSRRRRPADLAMTLVFRFRVVTAIRRPCQSFPKTPIFLSIAKFLFLSR